MITRYKNEEFVNAKGKDLLPLECEHCGKVFYKPKSMISYELNHASGGCKYCSIKCSDESHRRTVNVVCTQCGKKINVTQSSYNKSKTKRFFCSNSCSAKYNNAHRTTKKRKSHPMKRICKVCGKEYCHYYGKVGFPYTTKLCCSKECSEYLRKNKVKYLTKEQRNRYSEVGLVGGLKSSQVQREVRRSKNEILFCKLCEEHFKNVRHNEPIFNGWDADVIVDDKKYAVLWNGRWHYDELSKTTSLKQIQNRDRIKIKEIVNSGYTPYIIKDMGSYNPTFVREQFDKFLKDIEPCSEIG